jgi:WD40 repeat protein
MRFIAAMVFALVLTASGGKLQAQEQQPPVEIVRVVGHSKAITALAFSPDGKILATGSQDYTVKLWNVATGLMLRTIDGHPYEVRRVAFSGDGTEVLSVSNYLYKITINISDTATGQLKRTLANPEALSNTSLLDSSGSVAFSPDGSIMALAVSGSSGGRVIEIIDTHTDALLHRIKAAGDIHLSFSPDGRYLAATSDGCALTLWDPLSGKQIRQLGCGSWLDIFRARANYKFDAITFSGDGRTIAGFAGATLTQFDVASGSMLSTVDTGSTIEALTLSPDGSMLATSSYGKIDIRDATGKSIRKIEGHAGSFSKVALAFSPDSQVLATGGGDSLVRLWDAKNWSFARSLQGVEYSIGAVAVTADGATVASDGSGSTVLWNALEGRFLRRAQENKETSYGCVCSIGFSPDSRLLASGTRLATTLIWDTDSGRIVSSVKHSSEDAVVPRRSVAFLPSGTALLLGAMTEGREPNTRELPPVIWDLSAQKVLRNLTGEPHTYGTFQWAYPIAVSPDGKFIATASRDNVINLFDGQTGQFVRSVKAGQIAPDALAFSADGRILASASTDVPSSVIELWEVATGASLRTIDTHTYHVLSLAFSPDNRTLASAGEDKMIKLWNPDDGTQAGSLRGHSGSVTSLAFAVKKNILLSGSNDGSLKIWRTGSFDLLATLVAEPSGEWIVFTPEGFFEADGRANKLAIVRGREAYPIDAAYDLLHRPDLVREKLRGDPQGNVKAAAAKLDLGTIVTPH